MQTLEGGNQQLTDANPQPLAPQLRHLGPNYSRASFSSYQEGMGIGHQLASQPPNQLPFLSRHASRFPQQLH
jgi:hypothetical protein